MRLIYIDDSRDEELCVFSALAIPSDAWQDIFLKVKDWRKDLKDTDGIFLYKELHAWKFVSGRERPSDRIIGKNRRCEIFKGALKMLATLNEVRLFNAVGGKKDRLSLFERLLNRINRTMVAWDSRAILIIDEGSENEYTRLARKMHVFNPIPSSMGVWAATGKAKKNIPLDRIIEDPFFKKSSRSYFIQLVDFCAYALLRRERPIPSKTRYGLDKAFNNLSPIVFKAAVRKDPEGIIRI